MKIEIVSMISRDCKYAYVRKWELKVGLFMKVEIASMLNFENRNCNMLNYELEIESMLKYENRNCKYASL